MITVAGPTKAITAMRPELPQDVADPVDGKKRTIIETHATSVITSWPDARSKMTARTDGPAGADVRA
jgi:hypothetical protein